VGAEQLIATLLRLEDEDGSLSEDAKLLVLAVFESDAALSEALEEPSSARRPDIIDSNLAADPVGAYLTTISVAGFRGVGPKTSLELSPGPGLVIVAGRNGCGSSSRRRDVDGPQSASIGRSAPIAPRRTRGSSARARSKSPASTRSGGPPQYVSIDPSCRMRNSGAFLRRGRAPCTTRCLRSSAWKP
jgi:hypothetical protein